MWAAIVSKVSKWLAVLINPKGVFLLDFINAQVICSHEPLQGWRIAESNFSSCIL